MYNIFISQEKGKKIVPKIYGKPVIENFFLLFVFIVHEHVGTKITEAAREHAKHVSTWGRKRANKLARVHVGHAV